MSPRSPYSVKYLNQPMAIECVVRRCGIQIAHARTVVQSVIVLMKQIKRQHETVHVLGSSETQSNLA